VVSIPACHAGDPGSIPGLGVIFLLVHAQSPGSKKNQVLPGLEPGLQGSKPWVLTNYTIEPCLTQLRDFPSCVCDIPSHTHTRRRTESNSKQLHAAECEDKKRKGWLPVEASSVCVDTDEI
jgi:hypothetical protein